MHHTVSTVQSSNRTVIETDAKSTPLHTYKDCSLSWPKRGT